ncbi:glycerate kinase [Staphylococcus edaphicus]|uniref:Glycerate kinase n=1 Tax=Staphylococcus edaphicus TaxID=1955013 RepID=A0A2C6WGS4_9STAP|nr:glycerate kinase [Staphylococcus edaphicus]PHK49998.1 glycerate kinase [Staphylococcus edaphicus]UQW81742.1 glycerate kinase [Staphylococcus edaphicus]
MNIILAPDSFKGSMSATEVATYMSQSISDVFPKAEIHTLPVGDGGEGTMEALVNATDGTFTTVNVTGPLGNKVTAQYGVLNDKQTCVIEMAEASGLKHVPNHALNVMQATTFGTGELIKAALDSGYTKFILALGGSATNDAGAGMLQALGAKLLDQYDNEVGFGGTCLQHIRNFDLTHFDARIKHCTFTIATDVQNPLIGNNGASFVFGKQKGATEAQLNALEQNLTHWADLVALEKGIRLHDLPGAGAAGGLGGAFKAFFPSHFEDGIQVVIDYIKLDEYMDNADLVITGEGRIDFQTFYGKTPMGIAKFAHKYKVPVIFIGGSIDVDVDRFNDVGVIGAFSLTNGPMSLEDTITQSESLVKKATKNIVKTFFHKR